MRGVVVFFSCILGCLPSFSRGFCFLGLLPLLDPDSPARFFVNIKKLSPVFSLDAFLQRLTEGVPVHIHQGRTPPLLFNVVDIDV